jgi:iron complex outermembrane receptor protein
MSSVLHPQRQCSARSLLHSTIQFILRGRVPLTAAAAGFATTLAGAQSTDELEKLMRAEVVVTAQKREESSLDVPISLTVLSAAELDALRAHSIDDYILTIPNATFLRRGHLGPDVTLRGISSATGGLFDPIGVTVDDAGFGSTNTSSILVSRLLDIDRIEILRGPQGTLSGRNSLGGTINIISAKPNPEAFDTQAELDYSRYNTVFAHTVLNVPASEQLALRMVGFLERSDGAVENIGPAGGTSDTDSSGGRVAVRWLPAENIGIDAWIGYERQRYGIETALPLDRYPEGVREERIAALADLGGDYFDTDFLSRTGTGGGNVRLDIADHTDITDWIASIRAAYETPQHRLELIYGHFDFDASSVSDNDRSEFALSRRERFRETTADSAELRWMSLYQGSFNWLLGVSYSDEENPAHGAEQSGDGTPGSYAFASGFRDTQQITSEGLFANLFWDATPRLHLAAGVRVSRETTRFGSIFGFEEAALAIPIPIREAELTEFSPRLALTFDLAEHVNVYVQFATGYRAGFGADPLAIEQGLVPAEVKSESVRNYEAGLKGRFFDSRLLLTAALFDMEYDDLQVADYVYQDDTLIYLDFNAGEAYARGFEIEAQALLFDGLELRAGVGYVDTEMDEVPYYGEIFEDVAIPATRPWTAMLSGSYTHSLPADARATLRADYVWQDRAFEFFGEEPVSEQPEFKTLDLSFEIERGAWRMSLYARNVLDETFWLSTSSGPSLRGTFVTFMPRTYGVRVSYRLSRD